MTVHKGPHRGVQMYFMAARFIDINMLIFEADRLLYGSWSRYRAIDNPE